MGNFNNRNIKWSTWSKPHNEESKVAQINETVHGCYLYQHLLERLSASIGINTKPK